MTTLKSWAWCIDFTSSIGQKDQKIAPLFFLTRNAARTHNAKCFPKGKVTKVVIKAK